MKEKIQKKTIEIVKNCSFIKTLKTISNKNNDHADVNPNKNNTLEIQDPILSYDNKYYIRQINNTEKIQNLENNDFSSKKNYLNLI